MAYSTQPGPSATASGTGTQQSGATDDKEEIRIYGHNWRLGRAAVRRLYLCCVCSEAAAERTLCGQTSHAVCAACFTEMNLHHIRSCPCCREPFLASGRRTFHDSILKQHQSRMLRDAASIDCAQCRQWSGVEDGMERHAQQCGARLHPCPWSDAGCQWRGLQEQLQAHSYRCDWRPVICSLHGCQAQIPLRQRQEHEARCAYRPARPGLPDTDVHWGPPLRNILRQSFEQPFDGSEALSLSGGFAREQLRVSLVSVLAFGFHGENPADTMFMDAEAMLMAGEDDGDNAASCRWGCGFRAGWAQMLAHNADCPLFPVSCRFCPQTLARADLSDHMENCPDRPALCPLGCAQSGLRVRDMEDGSHARVCDANRPLVCSRCDSILPACPYRLRFRMLSEHLQACPRRPVACRWCLGCHPYGGFDTIEAGCRAWLEANAPVLEGRPLVLQSGAPGPVYVRSRGEDDAVFIYLPRQTLEAELANGTSAPVRNLTENLRFVWNGMSCALDFFCGAFFQASFRVRAATLDFHLTVSASLRLDDGTLIERCGARHAVEGGLRFHNYYLHGPAGPQMCTEYIAIESFYYMAGTALQNRGFLLHLQIVGRQN